MKITNDWVKKLMNVSAVQNQFRRKGKKENEMFSHYEGLRECENEKSD